MGIMSAHKSVGEADRFNRLLVTMLLLVIASSCASQPRETEATYVPDRNCRNGGEILAFDRTYAPLELAPLEWEALDRVEGTLVTEDDDNAVFLAEQFRLDVTAGPRILRCFDWPDP